MSKLQTLDRLREDIMGVVAGTVDRDWFSSEYGVDRLALTANGFSMTAHGVVVTVAIERTVQEVPK